MKLYFHLDRLNALSPGSVLKREPYRNESALPSLMPFADEAFLRHLESLCREGLSLHGAQYLISFAHGETTAKDLLLELQWEYVRWVYHKHLPSRFQSLFAFDELSAAEAFGAERGGAGRVYEAEASGRSFVGDMNMLVCDVNPNEQKRLANEYWSGKPYLAAPGCVPRWECLLDLPVRILREVTNE